MEIGQRLIVLGVAPLALAVRKTICYRRWVCNGGSALSAMIPGVWILERVFVLEIIGR